MKRYLLFICDTSNWRMTIDNYFGDFDEIKDCIDLALKEINKHWAPGDIITIIDIQKGMVRVSEAFYSDSSETIEIREREWQELKPVELR